MPEAEPAKLLSADRVEKLAKAIDSVHYPNCLALELEVFADHIRFGDGCESVSFENARRHFSRDGIHLACKGCALALRTRRDIPRNSPGVQHLFPIAAYELIKEKTGDCPRIENMEAKLDSLDLLYDESK